MKVAFRLDNPGVLVTAAAKAGPGYAARVAATIEYPEFRQPYADLAKYLDLFGPCQKAQQSGTEGWWSGYPDHPDEAQCREAAKLILANMLWSQIHFCRQLTTGEAKPKLGPAPEKAPPYRLDEPPVKTHWLNAESLYTLADAAVAFRFQGSLRKRATAPDVHPNLRDALLEAAAELEREPGSRELIALALAKVIVRDFETVHLRHLDAVRSKGKTAARPKPGS